MQPKQPYLLQVLRLLLALIDHQLLNSKSCSARTIDVLANFKKFTRQMLLFASKVSLNKESKTEKSKLINKIYLDQNVESLMLSGNKALSLTLDSNMTNGALQLHRNAAIAK